MRKGGWINGSRADDNQRIMTSDSSGEEAGHNAIISRPFRILPNWLNKERTLAPPDSLFNDQYSL